MEKIKGFILAVVSTIVIAFLFLFKRRGDKIDQLKEDIRDVQGEIKAYKVTNETLQDAKEISKTVDNADRDELLRMLDKDGTLRRTDKPN